MRWRWAAVAIAVILLLGTTTKRTREPWQTRYLTKRLSGAIILATAFPFSDGTCVVKVGVLEDTINTFFSPFHCVPTLRSTRLLAFGVAVATGTPTSIPTCDAIVAFKGLGTPDVYDWSRIKLGSGRTPTCDFKSPSTDTDIDEVGDTCWRVNPDPTITAEPFFFVALGDGDSTCPNGTTIEDLDVMLVWEELLE